MPTIKIYQREYPLPELHNQQLRDLERTIQRSQDLLKQGKRPAEPLPAPNDSWFKRWLNKSNLPQARAARPLDIEERFAELDNIVRNYAELMRLLQTHKDAYQGFFTQLADDVRSVMLKKSLEIREVEQERLAHAATVPQHRELLAISELQQQKLFKLVRLLGQAVLLALKKLELFAAALEELAENQQKQQQVLLEMLQTVNHFRKAYELQKKIARLEADVQELLQQALDLERLIAPYLGPFQTLIEYVSRTDNKLVEAVREIQHLTSDIVDNQSLNLNEDAEERMLEFLMRSQLGREQLGNFLEAADWASSDWPDAAPEGKDNFSVFNALDNLEVLISVRFQKSLPLVEPLPEIAELFLSLEAAEAEARRKAQQEAEARHKAQQESEALLKAIQESEAWRAEKEAEAKRKERIEARSRLKPGRVI